MTMFYIEVHLLDKSFLQASLKCENTAQMCVQVQDYVIVLCLNNTVPFIYGTSCIGHGKQTDEWIDGKH